MSTTAAQDEFAALTNPRSPRRDVSSSPTSSPSPQRSHRRTIRSSSSRRPHDSSDEDSAPEAPFRKGANDHIPLRASEANTGPKGVISDAMDARRAAREGRGKVNGAQKGEVNGQADEGARHWTQGSEDEEDDDDDDDDDFMQRYKTQRLAELNPTNKPPPSSPPGTLETVDGLAYLDALDAAPRAQVVAVYIYDASPLSDAYAAHLSTVASRHPATRFLALDADTAEMEPAGVPALLAYRAGDKFAALVPLRDEVPFTCNVVTNLEEALERYGII